MVDQFSLGRDADLKDRRPVDHPFGQINSSVCCIFGIEQGGNFPLFAAALLVGSGRLNSDHSSHHVHRPMAFGGHGGSRDKDLYAPWIVFWLHSNVASVAHRAHVTPGGASSAVELLGSDSRTKRLHHANRPTEGRMAAGKAAAAADMRVA
jgi:hypothetical protein